jgi:hypothetical protein
MTYFTSAIAAALAGEVVRAEVLAEFDFTSGTRRLWPGFGPLEAGGQTWEGIGGVGSISGIEHAVGDAAPQVTFGLSGVDPGLLGKALDASSEACGRDVTVFLQLFNDHWRPLDAPAAIYLGTMDQVRVKASLAMCTIQVTAETVFARRAIPPWGWLTDRDQNRLFPGDRGLEQVPAMVSKSVSWPVF